ncbi:MAG: type II toxin-antitoxin system VapC family toxin [Bacteroidales bacterium]|jgi:predicted nucleic acid-binding protein
MAIRYSTQNIPELVNRKVFFDANILIYIFWPTGSYHWENTYSSTFRSLLRQNNELIVDFLVISEVVNRAHRSEYEKHLAINGVAKNNLSYKQFRDSVDGQDALSDIYLIIESNILNLFTIVGKSFSKTEIQSFLTVEPIDFTDKGILSICKENGCILLTNDKDFKTVDIEILSSNPAILRN